MRDFWRGIAWFSFMFVMMGVEDYPWWSLMFMILFLVGLQKGEVVDILSEIRKEE